MTVLFNSWFDVDWVLDMMANRVGRDRYCTCGSHSWVRDCVKKGKTFCQRTLVQLLSPNVRLWRLYAENQLRPFAMSVHVSTTKSNWWWDVRHCSIQFSPNILHSQSCSQSIQILISIVVFVFVRNDGVVHFNDYFPPRFDDNILSLSVRWLQITTNSYGHTVESILLLKNVLPVWDIPNSRTT